LVTKVAAEFADDDLQARTGPDVFLKRQKAIIEAEAQLNEFKVSICLLHMSLELSPIRRRHQIEMLP
jgi:hypothetical protein